MHLIEGRNYWAKGGNLPPPWSAAPPLAGSAGAVVTPLARGLWLEQRKPQIKGGSQPNFFAKLDFELTFVQPSRAGDRTSEGVTDLRYPSGPAGWPRPFLAQKDRVFKLCLNPCMWGLKMIV